MEFLIFLAVCAPLLIAVGFAGGHED